MNYLKECLYDLEWQILRVNLSFKDYDSTKKSINKLIDYHKNASNKEEYGIRAWRILNLLNAVRMGFSGQRKFNSEESNLVKKEREQFQYAYRNSFLPKSWNWDRVKKDIKNANKKDLNKVYSNLKIRKEKSEKKGTIHCRPELVKFLKFFESVV